MPPKSVQPPGSGFSREAIQTPRGFARARLAAQLTAVPGDNFERNLQLVSAIEGIAREKKCTPSQLALAWVLAQGEDIVPIPGTKRMKFLEENIGALAVGLQPEELERINRVLPAGAASGQRYPEAVMAAVNR